MERDVGCAPWPEVALKIADDSRGPGSVRSPCGGGLETRGMPRRLGSLREGGHAANVASKESEWWHRQKWTVAHVSGSSLTGGGRKFFSREAHPDLRPSFVPTVPIVSEGPYKGLCT